MMEPKLCLCCLSQGFFKNLYESYVWLDQNEVYSEMLQECFNIVLSETEEGSICEPCVSQLRSALRFKRQVLAAERELRARLRGGGGEKPVEVKLELKNESGDESDDYFLADAARENSTDTVKCETEKKNFETRRKKPVKEKDGARTQRIRTLVSRLATSISARDLPDMATLKKKETQQTVKPSRKSKNNMWKPRAKHDNKKNRENLQTILKYSNATPFKNKSLLGFICGYCDSPFQDPTDLRLHTEKEHKKERLDFKSILDMTEYSVKLDVGDLICNLCDGKMDNLNILKEHLVKVHEKMIYSDIKDHILQYKLKKGDVYDCALCPSTYETFKMLKQHMNKHYTNYTCNKCDTSFATKRSLNSHKTTHLKGNFKCQHCDKVFPSKGKQHYHEKTKHMGTRNISNCPFCNEPFRSYYQRNQHLVKVHNSEAQYKCNVCDKAYILKSLLMYHIKKTHLLERNYQCTECGYKFFSKKSLTAHMVKHTGERNYSCEVCHKSYARKYTLREHMRIHNNDRRFRCEVCAMSFVQKCSLKSHLLSNHGISMAASDIASM